MMRHESSVVDVAPPAGISDVLGYHRISIVIISLGLALSV